MELMEVITTTVTAQKVTIDQVTTMPATSKNVLFPGHNHLTTGTDDLTLWLSLSTSEGDTSN